MTPIPWAVVVKWMFFLKQLLLYSGAWFSQTMCIVMMTMEGCIKIINYMTPGTGVLALGRGHIIYIVKCTICYSIVDFLFVLWCGCWYANISPSDRKSLILRGLLRPMGLLYLISYSYMSHWETELQPGQWRKSREFIVCFIPQYCIRWWDL